MIPPAVLVHRAEQALTTLTVRLSESHTSSEISELTGDLARLLAEIRAALP